MSRTTWSGPGVTLTMQRFWLFTTGVLFCGRQAFADEALPSVAPRFSPVSKDKRLDKSADLLVYLSITSAPDHSDLRAAARSTWLLPCQQSPLCDYSFFVDKTAASPGYDLLKQENESHGDMVFRDFCALMDRHPPYINYGNAPPRDESFTRVDSENQTVAMPDYPARRMYKIDWKVCFMRHSRDSGRMAAYHAFVEDDSFVCSENLLHQAALLRDKNVTHFRTGTPMFTGFDDSSTVMSGDVALAFAEHYLEPGFNCSRLVDHVGSSDWVGAMWLSWGNSWKKDWCDWRVSLERVAHINVTEPVINCQWVVDHQHLHEKLPFPCLEHPIILHHTFAAKILLLNSSFAKHTCEHMLLIDKVKDPNQMQMLWEASSGHAFHDFSEVFEHPGIVGWQKVLLRLRNEEAACRVAEAMRAKGVTLSAQEQDEFRTLAETCLFQRRRRRLRAAEVHGRLFADAGADTDIDADAGADTDAGADVESDTHRGSRSGPHTIPTHFTHSAHSEVLTQNSLSPEAFYRVLLESTQ